MAYFSGCYVMLNFQGVHLSRVLFLPHVDEVFLRLPLTWPDICWEIMWLASNLWVFLTFYTEMFTGFPPWKRMVWNYRIHPGRLTWNLRIHQYTPGRGKIIFQTIISRFYVNLPGCIAMPPPKNSTKIPTCQVNQLDLFFVVGSWCGWEVSVISAIC